MRCCLQQKKLTSIKKNIPDQCISRVSSGPLVLQDVLLDECINLRTERRLNRDAVKVSPNIASWILDPLM